MNTLLRRLRRDEHGSVATELTLLVPALIAMLLFVVLCGRIAEARLCVDDAAHQAVRAATLARTPAQASTKAATTARAALADAGVSCHQLAVQSNVEGLRPGSTVTATVTCHLALADLALLGIPGATTAESTASSVVDQWRSEAAGGAS